MPVRVQTIDSLIWAELQTNNHLLLADTNHLLLWAGIELPISLCNIDASCQEDDITNTLLALNNVKIQYNSIDNKLHHIKLI